MAKIQVLPQFVSDKIAAGEVCERPASVCKELVENSIDAGADKITVEIKNGGIKYIRVTDNGCGIDFEEVETAFFRHATSKLKKIEDLDTLNTMGFRGEALSSICAVSKVEVITKTEDEKEGTYCLLESGKLKSKEHIACNSGTTMIAEDLFANVPARMKFMKKDSTEAGYVADAVGRIALSHPEISFSLINDGKEVFRTTGDGNIKNVVLKIYGIECAKALIDVDCEKNGIKVAGVIGKPEISRGNRSRQTLFVNGRYIKNHVVSKVVEEAYKNAVMKGKFPFFVLGISLSPNLVDVNVHPAKTEVKFAYEKDVYDTVYYAVKNALYAVYEEKRPAPELKDSGYEKVVKSSKPAPSQLVMSFPKSDNRVFSFNEDVKPVNKPNTHTALHFPGNMTKTYLEYTIPPESIDEANTLPESVSEEKIEITEDNKPPVKILGQFFDTYIVFEQGESLFIVDQHAAHERLRFEELVKQKKDKQNFSQVMLDPVVLDLDVNERLLLRENLSFFAEYGFEIEEFGGDSFIVQKTPVITSDKEIEGLVLEILDILKRGKRADTLSLEDRTLDTIACKYAIKANKRLSEREMEDLLLKIEKLCQKGINTCPHGRPFKIEITKQEIEKMFKRIV